MTTTTTHSRRPVVSWGIALLVVLILVGGGYSLWHYVKRPPRARYDPVIAAVASGKIRENLSQPIDLPADLRGIVPRDQVLVTRRPDGTFMIVFPTFRGDGEELVGLLYTSRPLTGTDTFPNHAPNAYSRPLISCGSYSRLVLDDRIDEHWYHVSYAMHKGQT
jgi:hypothetical protein